MTSFIDIHVSSNTLSTLVQRSASAHRAVDILAVRHDARRGTLQSRNSNTQRQKSPKEYQQVNTAAAAEAARLRSTSKKSAQCSLAPPQYCCSPLSQRSLLVYFNMSGTWHNHKAAFIVFTSMYHKTDMNLQLKRSEPPSMLPKLSSFAQSSSSCRDHPGARGCLSSCKVKLDHHMPSKLCKNSSCDSVTTFPSRNTCR